MIFSGYEQMGEKPFKTVLFHGLVRDSQGRKMSKSLGNGIDPLEIIDKYGADALRLTLITGNAPGNDMRFYIERVEASRNFANKVWNASRFIMINMEGKEITEQPALEPVDKWILSKLNSLIKEVTDNMENFELGIAVQKVYDFIWDEFCDWYIEMVKSRLYDENCTTKFAAQYTLNKVLKDSLKLLHPVMPFVTEKIYMQLYHNDESIMISKWPEYTESLSFEKEEEQVEKLKTIIVGIRNLRTNLNVHPSKKSKLIFVTKTANDMLKESSAMIQKLGFANEIDIQENKENIPQNAMSVLADGIEVYIPFEELVDLEAEKQRLQGERAKLLSEVARGEKMLSNPGFVNKAPESKINEEKAKLAKYKEMLEKVEERIKSL